MATPVKAFVDPVGIMRQVPSSLLGALPVVAISWSAVQPAQMLPPAKKFDTVIVPKLTPSYFRLSTPPIRIPTPPMGRMIVNTFPPIYKERPKPVPVVPRESPVWWVYPQIDNANNLPASDVYQAEEFDLFNYLPLVYREIDETDGSFQNYVWVFNQIWAQLLYETASIPSHVIFSDTTRLIKEVCDSRGNPFQFLNETQLRRAADNLIHIYKRRGDQDGIVHVVWFLLGVRIQIAQDFEFCWRVGISKLGVDTILSSHEAPMFRVTIPANLSAELQSQVRSIVQFMKPAHLYYRFVTA